MDREKQFPASNRRRKQRSESEEEAPVQGERIPYAMIIYIRSTTP